MPTFANIQDEIATMLTALDDVDDAGIAQDTTPALLTYLDQLAVQEAEKVDAIAYADRKAKQEIDFLKSEETRLCARRRHLESRQLAFRDYLRSVFLHRGLQKVKGHNATISLRLNPATVDIAVPVDSLPGEFVETRVEYHVRKKDLTDALKSGREITGVRLRQTESIQIR